MDDDTHQPSVVRMVLALMWLFSRAWRGVISGGCSSSHRYVEFQALVDTATIRPENTHPASRQKGDCRQHSKPPESPYLHPTLLGDVSRFHPTTKNSQAQRAAAASIPQNKPPHLTGQLPCYWRGSIASQDGTPRGFRIARSIRLSLPFAYSFAPVRWAFSFYLHTVTFRVRFEAQQRISRFHGVAVFLHDEDAVKRSADRC